MIRLLFKSLRRQLLNSRTLFALSITGVALGVSSVVAIQTLNQGAIRAFDGGMRAVSGQADLSISGTTPAFDETRLVRVLADPDVAAAWPICRVDAAVRGHKGLLLDIVGLDLLTPIRLPLSSDAGTEEGFDFDALTRPGWVALTPALAEQQGWSVGDTLNVSSGSRIARLQLGALVDFQALEPLAPRNLAVMDISQVQTLLTRAGRIHQIDIRLVETADPQVVAERLARELGPGLQIKTPQQRSQDAAGLMEAFRLNLTALSLISVFVGLFLVLTSVQASLSRRRREFGILRCLGATPRQMIGMILGETAMISLPGVAIGIPLGYAVALRNIETVSATLTNIYILQGVDKLVLPPSVIALGAVVGIGGAMIGAIWPALEMARRDPLMLLAPVTLHEQTGRSAGRLSRIAVMIAAVATLGFALAGSKTPWGGFIYGALMMLALPLVVPLMVGLVAGRSRPRGMGFSLSLRNLSSRLQTTSLAVAALAITVSMLVGITLLVGSFRQTLINWLDVSVRADIYVSTESWVRAGNEAVLDPGILAALRALPDAAAVEEQRRIRIGSADGEHLIWLNGITIADRPGGDLARRLPLMSGEASAVSAGLGRGEIMIGEPLARKASLAIGDSLVLAGYAGPAAFRIAGIAYDYTSEGGTAFIEMSALDRVVPPGSANNAAIFLHDPAAVDSVVTGLRTRFADRPLVFRSNRDLRREVLSIFDQTFAVTRTLQSLALLIAVLGVALNLLVQSRERSGELAVLRSLGATRTQIFRLFLGEGAAIGSLGLLMGLGGGIGLAALLILYVNRQWFGWTIQPEWNSLDIARQMLIVLLATVAAAIIPALKAGLAGSEQLTRDDL